MLCWREEKRRGWCSSGREVHGSSPPQPPSAPLRTKAALSLPCLLARYKRALFSGSKSPFQAWPPSPWASCSPLRCSAGAQPGTCPSFLGHRGVRLWRGPQWACPLPRLGQHMPLLLGFCGGAGGKVAWQRVLCPACPAAAGNGEAGRAPAAGNYRRG